jgi:hypothetical protein
MIGNVLFSLVYFYHVRETSFIIGRIHYQYFIFYMFM